MQSAPPICSNLETASASGQQIVLAVSVLTSTERHKLANLATGCHWCQQIGDNSHLALRFKYCAGRHAVEDCSPPSSQFSVSLCVCVCHSCFSARICGRGVTNENSKVVESCPKYIYTTTVPHSKRVTYLSAYSFKPYPATSVCKYGRRARGQPNTWRSNLDLARRQVPSNFHVEKQMCNAIIVMHIPAWTPDGQALFATFSPGKEEDARCLVYYCPRNGLPHAPQVNYIPPIFVILPMQWENLVTMLILAENGIIFPRKSHKKTRIRF